MLFLLKAFKLNFKYNPFSSVLTTHLIKIPLAVYAIYINVNVSFVRGRLWLTICSTPIEEDEKYKNIDRNFAILNFYNVPN